MGKQGQILGIRCALQASERRGYGRMDGPTDGRTDGLTDGQMERQTLLQRCEDASKKKKKRTVLKKQRCLSS